MNISKSELKIHRLAGGVIVDCAPLFSPDGEILFVVLKNLVRAYSTLTGQWLRDLDGIGNPIVGMQFDLFNSKLLVACSSTGEICSWKWKSGVVNKIGAFNFPTSIFEITSFNLINLSGEKSYGLITWQQNSESNVKIEYVDLETNDLITDSNVKQLELLPGMVKVSVGSANLKYFAVAQQLTLDVVFISTGKWKRIWQGKSYDPYFTLVRCHPTEHAVMTGDNYGRLRVYRNLKENKPVWTLYHWHSTKVYAAEFSVNGAHIYSGGSESVVVKWSVKDPDNKEFVTRISTTILHIAVSSDNQKFSVSTDDNGIRIFNYNRMQTAVIQNFTRASYDRTGRNPFPVGLKINPKTTSLVLNGREGYLQFYSTHTRSLLYNLEIVQENILTIEPEKILVNTRVMKTALSMNWLVTAECWDDTKLMAHTRLKFWEFNLKSQKYELNTNAEMAHLYNINALEFSSLYDDENLLCASAGGDNFIKVWKLIASDNIYRKGKFWYNIARTSYKNLPVYSLNFSQDGSVLASGCGNTLCVWTSENLKLKCALSAPAALDGSTNKIVLKIPKNIIPGNGVKSKVSKAETLNKSKLLEKRKEMLDQIKLFLKSEDKQFLKKLDKENIKRPKMKIIPINSLKLKEQELLVKKIIALNNLNLYQKFELFSFLRLSSKLDRDDMKTKLQTILSSKNKNKNDLEIIVDQLIKNLYKTNKCIMKSKFKNYQTRKIKNYSKCLPFSKLFATKVMRNEIKMNGNSKMLNGNVENDIEDEEMNDTMSKDHEEKLPVKVLSLIKHVVFGSGELPHLVIVCTENRLLVWNLLTLKLQSSYKLSVQHIVIDPYTSLVAAFTLNNELYVFLPNIPMPLYHRKDMPDVYGAAWVPRQISRQQSLSVDWQAVSQLFFLSKDQELLYLISDNDPDMTASAISLANENPQAMTPFGAILSKHMESNSMQTNNFNTKFSSIGKSRCSVVKEMLNLSTHTMCPANQLCNEFIKSFLIVVTDKDNQSEKSYKINNKTVKDKEQEDVESDEDVIDPINLKIENRKKILSSYDVKFKEENKSDLVKIDTKLNKIAKSKVKIQL